LFASNEREENEPPKQRQRDSGVDGFDGFDVDGVRG
jgi:hypothetical protein